MRPRRLLLRERHDIISVDEANKRGAYPAETLLRIAADPKHLGARIAITIAISRSRSFDQRPRPRALCTAMPIAMRGLTGTVTCMHE